MDIQPLRTEADYRAALAEVSPMFDNEPEPGTTDGAALSRPAGFGVFVWGLRQSR